MAVPLTLRRVDPTDAGPSDAECLARVAAGDLGALAVLYERHATSVMRFVSRATCRSPDTHDIVQETFLSAVSSAARFDGRVSCRPWLLGIAAFHVMHHRRAATRLRRFMERLVFVQPEEHDGVRAMEARQTLDATGRALARLAPAKRIALLMAEVEGLTGDEIAAALHLPTGTVWRRIFDARAELRRALTEEDGS